MATRRILSAAEAVAGANSYPLDLLANLRPTIIGPRAALKRYAVASEKTLLGAYDKLADTLYDWPGLTDGDVVDLNNVRIYLESARLNYFNKYTGSNGSCQASSTYPNRVRAANYVFKTANGTNRSADFYDRDVAVGDVVTVRNGGTTLTSTVAGFVGETVAATRGNATLDSNNAANQSLSSSITQTAGDLNDIYGTVDDSGYNGLPNGYINRTFTVTVTQGSNSNDATTAQLRVRSSDGLYDKLITPATFGSPTTIWQWAWDPAYDGVADTGNKLDVTFDVNAALSSASVYGIDEDDFRVGQVWTVTVAQAFTRPTVASGGTYTGTADATYIVTVSRGATLASGQAKITVMTADGSDSSGPTTVTASGAAVTVGSYGITITFTGTQVRKGDIYTIACTAETEGAIKTLVLADDVPVGIRGVEVDLRLFIPQTGVELPSTRSVPTVAYNWSAAADGPTVEAGIYMTDATLTDNGVLVPVPLESADMYIQYRAWVAEGAGVPIRISSRADIEALLGTVTPSNPLAWAVDCALANTAGALLTAPKASAATYTDVVIAVPIGTDPTDTTLWTDALSAIEGEPDAGQIVPLTIDANILALVKAHVTAQSADAVGMWRSMWVTPSTQQTVAVLNASLSDDEGEVLGTVTAAPGISPTEYTQLTLTSDNASFTTAGIRAGDVVRVNYQINAVDVTSYDSYVVEEVVSATTLRFVTGPVAAINTPAKFEIWRTRTKDEYVDAIIAEAATYANSGRSRVVWPSVAGYATVNFFGYHLCAALAGLAGSVMSQQGLRGVGVAKIDDVSRASEFFTPAQLNNLAAGGVFVVDADKDGNVYVRAAVTPDTGSLNTKYEMVVRNTDVVRYAIKDSWETAEGVTNVTTYTATLLDSLLKNVEARLKTAAASRSLGAPVTSLDLLSVNGVSGEPDKIAATVAMTGPVELNSVILTINLSTGA